MEQLVSGASWRYLAGVNLLFTLRERKTPHRKCVFLRKASRPVPCESDFNFVSPAKGS